jgi:hypothetical protein
VWRILATHVDIVAQTLKRKDSSLASDVSVGNMRLYAEHPLIHGLTRQGRREGKLSIKKLRSGRTGPNPLSQSAFGIDEGWKEN